jgi:hypothetical protein
MSCPVSLSLASLGALAAMLCAATALANDSTASLDAGGLNLTYNPDISMESEDLHLSPGEVHVDYRFRNLSERDIDTLVAFPLPVIIIGEEGNYDIQGRDAIDVMAFKLAVDGKPLTPSVDIRAARFGVDVTEVLKRYNIPPTMIAADNDAIVALHSRLDDLPEQAKAELERFGVIDWNTTFGAEDKPLANAHWDTHLAYYWFQTFPAHKTVDVTHRYKPVPGRFFFTKETLADPEMRKRYCMDQAFISAAQKALNQSPQKLLDATELKYVLTTAGNWQGPIQKFQMTIEKPSAEALVSLCANGVKRAGPTTFTLSAEDYVPESDLAILFLAPMRAE